MDYAANPYRPGAALPRGHLVGYDRDIDRFGASVRALADRNRARGWLVTGQHGTGRSAVVESFVDVARHEGWAYARETAYAPEFYEGLERSVEAALDHHSRVHRTGTLFRRTTKAVTGATLPGGSATVGGQELRGSLGGVTFDPARRGHVDAAEPYAQRLRALFDHAGKVAGGTGAVVVVDDADNLDDDQLEGLGYAARSMMQGDKHRPVMLVLAGGPGLRERVNALGIGASFAKTTTGRLSLDDSREMLTRPAADEGVVWEPDALDAAAAAGEGFPLMLHTIGHKAWENASLNRPYAAAITAADVEHAVTEAHAELDDGYYPQFTAGLADDDVEYLVALAHRSTGPDELIARPDEAVSRTVDASSGDLRDRRARLLDAGLLTQPAVGLIQFGVPQLDAHFRRLYPGAAGPAERTGGAFGPPPAGPGAAAGAEAVGF